MSYELLCSLYFGEGSNADLTSRSARERLHVPTDLEQLVSASLETGRDVVLTGNPGDGKSHLARTLHERGLLHGAELVRDLSERSTQGVVELWRACRAGGRRVVLCGNEGPLRELLEALRADPALTAVAEEIGQQVGRLVVDDASRFPPEPQTVALIDLADRSVLSVGLIDGVLRRVCSDEFLPRVEGAATQTSVGRNMVMLQVAEARERLARLLALAGRRLGEHVTFRELWAAVAYAISGARSLQALRAEVNRSEDLEWASCLDNFQRPRASGRLIEAAATFVDPARVPSPDLDEALWSRGEPVGGEWFIEPPIAETPELLWSRGRRDEALERQRRLKRLVALAHERGERLVAAMERAAPLPSAVENDALLREVVAGLRRLYLTERDEASAPPWLASGLPLWLGFSYADGRAEDRPHVAVHAEPESSFRLHRPLRAPWLGAALGPPPEVAWLFHAPSGTSLRVDPVLLGALRNAARSAGPTALPERAQRFLVRIAGWDERRDGAGLEAEPFAVIQRPRGGLLAAGFVRRTGEGGSSYARDAQG